MPFDFDKLTDRRDSFSLKWNVAEHELPLWVADMDFETAPEIVNAISQKAASGILGYTIVPDEYLVAVCDWWRRRHHFAIDKSWLIYTTGVVPAISSIIRKLTSVAEKIVIQSPVYNIFYNSIVNNGRQLLDSPLIYHNGEYCIDFEDLEQKLADPQTTLMILCNPHNPIGKIWSKEVLAQIGELCVKHHVVVLSDEIHCDLTAPNRQYTPFASISKRCEQNSISCIAPTKAFNLAGLQTASIVVPNPVLRHKVSRGLNTDEVAEPNAFAIEATIAAFTKGEAWLSELCAYIQHNKEIASGYIKQNIPQLHVVQSEATYLLWLDCTALACDSEELVQFIRQQTGLYLSAGGIFGESGKFFLRINIATPRIRLLDALVRLQRGIESYLNKHY